MYKLDFNFDEEITKYQKCEEYNMYQLNFDFINEEDAKYQNFKDFGLTKSILFNLLKNDFRECYKKGFIVTPDSDRCKLEWVIERIKYNLNNDYQSYKISDDKKKKENYFYNYMRYDYITKLMKRIEDKQEDLIHRYETEQYIKNTFYDFYFNKFNSLDSIKKYLMKNQPKWTFVRYGNFFDEGYAFHFSSKFSYKNDIAEEEINFINKYKINEETNIDDNLLKRINLKVDGKVCELLEKYEENEELEESFSDKCRSKDESKIYKILVEKYGKDDVLKEYRNKLYPFHCDFYIKSKDLYIEYQGFYLHGKEKFIGEENQLREIKELIKKNDSVSEGKIQTWAFMDIVKRKIAKINKLNWIEFFNFEEFNEWYENNA